MTIAGGCKWPTVPAYRYLVCSDDATGVYLPLNTSTVILEMDLDVAEHEHGIWEPLGYPPWLYYCQLEKFYIRSKHPQFDYFLRIMLTLVGRQEIAFIPLTGKCNVDIPIGDQIGGPLRGRVGRTFRLRQVEFDALMPP